MTSYHFPEPDAATRREHRARWFVYTGRVVDGQRERIPWESTMRGSCPAGFDAACKCGTWESRTGGAVRSAVQDEIARHKSDAQWEKDRER